MMTKYQIVVTKLETIVHNVSRTTEAKKKHRMKRALQRMADNVRQTKVKQGNKQKLVCMHFESKLGAMVSALHRFTIGKQVHASFAAWKNGATIQKSKHN